MTQPLDKDLIRNLDINPCKFHPGQLWAFVVWIGIGGGLVVSAIILYLLDRIEITW